MASKVRIQADHFEAKRDWREWREDHPPVEGADEWMP